MPHDEDAYQPVNLFRFKGQVMVEAWAHEGPFPSLPNTEMVMRAIARQGVCRKLVPLSA